MTKPSSLRRMSRYIWVVLSGAVILLTFVGIAWALRKGFDLTDEAWVYSLISSNRIAVGEAWGFQHLLHPLYLTFGESVLAFRILRLGGYILLSVALVAVVRLIGRRLGFEFAWYQWLFVLAVAQVGTFLAFAYPPRYLGYNELSAWFSQIGIAIMLLLLAQRLPSRLPPLRLGWLWASWVVLGVLTVLLALSKITSGVLFALLGLVVLLVPGTGLALWKRVVAVVAGMAGAAAVLWLAGYPFADVAGNLFTLAFDPEAQSAYDHPVDELLEVYRLSVVDAVTLLAPTIILLATTVGLLSLRLVRHARGKETPAFVSRIAVVTGILSVATLFALPKEWVFTDLGALTVYLGIGLLVIFAGSSYPALPSPTSPRTVGSTVAVAAILVIATPFIGAMGTNNAITGQLIYAATLWATAFGLGLVALSARLRSIGSGLSALPAAILLSIIVLAALAVRGDLFEHPYRTPLYALQGTQTSAPHMQGMRLTAGQAEWADWLAEQAQELDAADVPTVALSASAGLLFFNNSSFASPWVDQFWPVSFASITHACEKSMPEDLIVLQPGNVETDSATAVGAIDALGECGFEFPEDFELVAEHESSDAPLDMRIWRLQQ